MNSRINEIVNNIKAMQLELEDELKKAGQTVTFHLSGKKIHFDQGVKKEHSKLKVNLFRYALFPRPRHVLVAPFTYALLPALLLLDLLASLYHAVCFPLLEIPKVKRSDYFAYDRHHLAYLNLLEMVNCIYCSYGNGLISYLKEIFARTEQYWCPIKHAHRVHGAHSHYKNFIEYADAEAFRRDLEKVRKFKD